MNKYVYSKCVEGRGCGRDYILCGRSYAVLRNLAYLDFICIVYSSLFPVAPPSEAGQCLASQETLMESKVSVEIFISHLTKGFPNGLLPLGLKFTNL